MAYENHADKFGGFAATEDLNDPSRRFKAVTIGGTIAATTLQAAGILVSAPKSGEAMSVVITGVEKAVFGAAVTTPGWPLKITTSGFVIGANSGDVTCGRFWQAAACASGDLAQGYFDFSDLGNSRV